MTGTGATGRAIDAAPLRFLVGVVTVWVVARGAILLGWRPPELSPTPSGSVWRAIDRSFAAEAATPPPRTAAGGSPLAMTPRLLATPHPAVPEALAETWATSTEPLRRRRDDGFDAAQLLLLATYTAPPGRTYRRSSGAGEAMATNTTGRSRWSGSAWAFVRGGGHPVAIDPVGQIGGGQAGVRALYRLDDRGRLSLSGRVSHSIGGPRQGEAALGIDVRPIAGLPVHLLAERRIALDRGGRDAWTLGAAGGVYDVPVAPGWRLDAYAEAGVVGARRRDRYADGAARIARAIDLGGGASLAVGGGVWGAAQPGAARLDIGPTAVLRLPVEGRTVALALDWREQVAGSARPHSGVAFTAAVDF